LRSHQQTGPRAGILFIEEEFQVVTRNRFTFRLVLLLTLVLTLFPSAALAATITSGGITLTYPSYPLNGPALASCEPWLEPSANTIRLTGIPEGATVKVTFGWSNPYSGTPNLRPTQTFSNVTGGSLVVPVDYPMDTTAWPVFNTTTNERAIAIAALIQVFQSNGTAVAKFTSRQWWVRCLPPPAPFQGCTPGYWRQDQHFDSWVPTGFAPGDDFETVFGVNASFDPDSLLNAVWLGGGGENALARHAVAALLNAAHPDVNYQFTIAEIIAGVQNAYATGNFEPFKTQLDFANNAGCPLN
jgi:hypothetical protein